MSISMKYPFLFCSVEIQPIIKWWGEETFLVKNLRERYETERDFHESKEGLNLHSPFRTFYCYKVHL